MKRLLTSTVVFLCCAAISFAQFTGTVSDAQGVKYTANDDESTCYVSGHDDPYSTTIEIPETFEGSKVTSIGDFAFYGCSGLTSLTIPKGVTSIGNNAYSGCSGLTSLTIPEGVTSIGDCAFYGCSGLTSLTIPSSVTSVGFWALWGCSSLTSLTIPEGVTSIGDFAFEGCRGLTSLTIPSTVTSIGTGPFRYCSGLTSIVVEDGNTVYDSRDNCNAIIKTSDNSLIAGCKNTIISSSVTSIGNNAYSGCSGLTSLTIPSSVMTIGKGAFTYCSGLTTLTIPSSVTSIGDWAFFSCSGLTSLTIPSSVTSIGGTAFSNCRGLTSLTIPEGVTSIGDCAFQGCSGLTSVTIPSSVTLIGESAFQLCRNLTTLTIPEGVTSIGRYAFNECSGLTSLIIPSSVTSIGEGVFYGCSGLTSVTVKNPQPIEISSDVFYRQNAILIVPKGSKALYEEAESWKLFETIIEPFDGTLSDSQGVKYSANNDDWTCRVSGHETSYNYDITIPEIYEGRVVTSIGDEALWECSSLTSLTIPEGVTSIGGYAFSGCSGLTSMIIPEGVTSIGGCAFSGCSGLTTIVVDENNAVYDSRDNCNAIIKTSDNTLIAGCQSTIIPSSVTSIGGNAFSGCSGLTSLTIPEGVMSIGNSAFSGCSGLTTIVVDENNSVYDSRDNCNAIINTSDNRLITGCQNTIIPSSVTEIGRSAFSGCSSLTSLTIPSSVTSIDIDAFHSCSGLTEVYCYGEIIPTTGYSVFNHSSIGTATLYVPVSALDDYKTTKPWSGFKNIVSMGGFLTIGETGMATLYSTSDLDFTEVSGVKAYIASVFNRQTGELTLTRINDVPARTGLLIKGEPGTYHIPSKESFSIVSNLLKGVTVETNINATEDGYVNYVLNNGSQGVGFYKVGTAGANLEAGRAYLQIPAETATSRNALKLRFDDEDEATGISASLTNSEERIENSAVYDLQGRRVEQPQRGLYIRNGKKVVVK